MVEERSKVAAATAAVVPFHCVVCFDEFSLSQNRPPVVLPCGHTYVCAPCAKRLKRCMECREPLFYTLKPNPTSSNRTPVPPAPSMYGRYSPTTNAPSTPPYPHVPPQQIPCSIPKNVVLISMMEAAERQARESYADDTNGSMSACDDEEEYDLNRILAGLTTFAGPCGTYAVKEGGLVWTPQLDMAAEHDDPDDRLHVTASTDSIEISQPCTLEPGQTVQVVAWESGGRAKLARNAGYVLAHPSQLVKVGGPLEKACRLEGLLDTVINRGRDLQKELEENYRVEEALRREIEAELLVEPVHPVITDAPPPPSISPAQSKDAAEPTTPKEGCRGGSGLQTPHESPVGTTGLPIHRSTDIQHYEFPSPNSMDCFHSPGLPSYRTRQASSFDESIFDYGCGVSILGSARLFSAGPTHENSLTESPHSPHRFRSMSSDAHDALQHPTSSFDAIDFRTGLSGHRGLNAAHTHGKWNQSPTPRSRLMMSEHRGIGRVRGPLQKLATPNTPSS